MLTSTFSLSCVSNVYIAFGELSLFFLICCYHPQWVRQTWRAYSLIHAPTGFAPIHGYIRLTPLRMPRLTMTAFFISVGIAKWILRITIKKFLATFSSEFLEWKCMNFEKMSLKIVPRGPICDIPALVQAWSAPNHDLNQLWLVY